MWSRFLPQASVVAQLLADGALGEVVLVQADLGVRMPFDAASRAFDPELGGGALLDLGIYPVWFAHSVLGAPSEVVARGSLAPTGVDAHSSLVLSYESGALASVTSSFLAATPRAAAITGTLGRIEYTGSFKDPSALRLTLDGQSLDWRDDSGIEGSDGLCYQAAAVANHISNGAFEAPEHDLADTIAVLRVLESAREQLGAR
jgi:predicted dehydrogenase